MADHTPYTVHYGWMWEGGGTFATLDAAIIHALTARSAGRAPYGLRILGDGVDYDGDSEGYRMCSDGLTEEERERIEDAGL